jgi:hypothetical protein
MLPRSFASLTIFRRCLGILNEVEGVKEKRHEEGVRVDSKRGQYIGEQKREMREGR